MIVMNSFHFFNESNKSQKNKNSNEADITIISMTVLYLFHSLSSVISLFHWNFFKYFLIWLFAFQLQAEIKKLFRFSKKKNIHLKNISKAGKNYKCEYFPLPTCIKCYNMDIHLMKQWKLRYMLQKVLCTGHLPLVQYLIEIGANIEAKDQNIVFLTSFHIAFEYNLPTVEYECFPLLLSVRFLYKSFGSSMW